MEVEFSLSRYSMRRDGAFLWVYGAPRPREAIDAIAEVIDKAPLAARLFPWGAGRGSEAHRHSGRPIPWSHLPSEPGCSTGTSSLLVILAAKVKAEVT